jgi:hypothetical protein
VGVQDIDFDEIDRAVNSLASTGFSKDTKEEIAVPSPVAQTVEPETPADVSSEPGISAEPEPTPEPVVVPVVTSPAVRRSGGRFMDVVHPSSDMRPSAPSAPSLHREVVIERDEVAKRPEPAAIASTAFHWPDTTVAARPAPEPVVEAPVVEPTPEPEPAVILPEQEEPAGSLESPFLMDAKVEKRPLGAFSGADEGLQLIEEPFPVVAETTPEPEPAEAPTWAEEPAEVPPELHESLLKLDAHGDDDEEELLLEATNPPDMIPTPDVETVQVGPTSITQQYTEQPSTASQPSGSIFDTEAYHQPLAHPVKKRSGALIAVLILALILVGGGIGALVYFFVLPSLG